MGRRVCLGAVEGAGTATTRTPSLSTVVAVLELMVRERDPSPSGRGTSTLRRSFPLRDDRVLVAVSRGEGLTGSIRNFVVLVAVSMGGGGATGTHEELELIGCWCIHVTRSSESGREEEVAARCFCFGCFDFIPLAVNISFALSKSTQSRRLSCTTMGRNPTRTTLSTKEARAQNAKGSRRSFPRRCPFL